MKTIWKYSVEHGISTLEMPEGARILSVHNQGGKPVMWALVDPDAPTVQRKFLLAGTGHGVSEDPTDLVFLGTVLIMDGCVVWHIFEIRGK